MKWVLLLLAVNALVVPGALADVNDLSNGVLIAHHVAAASFTVDVPTGSWCTYYTGLAEKVTTCDEQVNEIPVTPNDVAKLWVVLAAWTEDKVCAGVEFGLDYTPSNSVDAGYLISEQRGTCFPVSGLTIESGSPDPAWPEPGSGIALVCTGDVNWTGNYIPVYYFWGYTYGAGTVDITLNPTSGSAQFTNAATTEFLIGADFRGALGLGGTIGVKVCPLPPPEPGACCFDGGNDCQFVTPQDCASLGGNFLGAGTVCDPNPCPTTWACCVGNDCFMLPQTECTETYGGGWLSGHKCTDPSFACSAYNVCCLNETCLFVTLAECNAQGGEYVTDPLFPNCTTTNCPVPVENTSWSTIKAIYR